VTDAYGFFKEGLSQLESGNYIAARDMFLLAEASDNQRPSIQVNLAASLVGTHEYGLALYHAVKAIELDPSNANAHLNAGLASYGLHQLDEALAYLKKALSLCQKSEEIKIALSRVYAKRKDYSDALSILQSGYDNSYSCKIGLELAQLYKVQGDHALSEDLYQSLISKFPRDEKLLQSYGYTLQVQDRHEEQINFLKNNIFNWSKGHKFFLGMGLYAATNLCSWEEAKQFLSAIYESLNSPDFVMSPLPILTVTDNLEIINKVNGNYFSNVYSRSCHTIHNSSPLNFEPPNTQRIRIAYISADFREHPVAQLMRDIFLLHDRGQFDVFGFSLFPGLPDSEARILKTRFDHYYDVSELDSRSASEFIMTHKIDIAIDLMGYTSGARPEIFIHRCAPVQINYLGYPSSTNAISHDYIIADKFLIDEAQEAHYLEKIIRLKCFMPNSERPKSHNIIRREDFGFTEEQLLFCCFNNVSKITADMFYCWLEILTKVEGSVLWLGSCNDTARQNLMNECLSRNVSRERIIFSPRFPSLADHLARISLCDLALDTFPYNGHTTSADALWAGVPVLTCRGDSFASRVSSSLLAQLGLKELVVESIQEYQGLAIRLGSDRLGIKLLKDQLMKSKSKSTLFDIRTYLKDYEAQLQRIYRERLKPGAKAT
jgi:protein O-GlcNAc transferase